MSNRSHVTTHVLDAVSGLPAVGVGVTLESLRLAGNSGDRWDVLATSVTNADGRASELGPEALPAGTYRVTFATGSYFEAIDVRSFYPEVTIAFLLDDESAHYHVPLLLSPFAFSTYRGS